MPRYITKSTQDWDHDRLPVLIGKILAKESGGEKMDNRLFMTVETQNAIYRVYESKGLEEAFAAAEPGRWVELEFLELVKLDRGRTFKRYRSAVFELEKGEQPPLCPPPVIVGAPRVQSYEPEPKA